MVFQPGNKLSTGRPKTDPYLVQVKKMNKDEVERVMADFMKGDRAKVEAALEDPKTPMLHLMVAYLIKKATSSVRPDPAILNFLLDRTIGKVKENVEVDVSLRAEDSRHDNLIAVVPRGEIIELVRLKAENSTE